MTVIKLYISLIVAVFLFSCKSPNGADKARTFDVLVTVCVLYKYQARITLEYNDEQYVQELAGPTGHTFKDIAYSENDGTVVVRVAIQNGFGAWRSVDHQLEFVEKEDCDKSYIWIAADDCE